MEFKAQWALSLMRSGYLGCPHWTPYPFFYSPSLYLRMPVFRLQCYGDARSLAGGHRSDLFHEGEGPSLQPQFPIPVLCLHG